MNVWWSYVVPNTNVVNFCDIFSDIGSCFGSAQAKSHENQKIGLVRIILDKIE